MTSELTRRGFLQSAAAAVAAGPVVSAGAMAQEVQADNGIVVIASGNGLKAVERAGRMIADGQDVLDAVVSGVNIVEEDPSDRSVGYGGLPNEDGVVELDSCVMHGPTHNAGAVASLQHVKTPSRVATLVMERTDHVLLVGKGAWRFAKAHGFKKEELLTEEARRIWLRWKENHSDRDDWQAPMEEPVSSHSRRPGALPFTWGTINCCGRDAKGNLSGVTTTSGLSYKIPGRVGDSPIIGAGLYVDNEIGAAGSTGRGESVILNCGSYAVVEQLRQGATPEQACLNVLKQVVDHIHDPRLLQDDGKPAFNVNFYAVDKRGRYGAAAIWSGGTFAVHAGGTSEKRKSAYLYEYSS
jgi:N4-(beta-N-acetylglucosaminyl)-L-asparaginase